jgi:hypothetical protein
VVSKASSDSDVSHLANAQADTFAAWCVEGRAPDQLLLCDYLRRTRSWLMVAPVDNGGTGTSLYFGSAVVPASGQATIGSTYDALLGFHKLYLRILLRAAKSRLISNR